MLGVLGFGTVVLAVFGVGAGHVALHQIGTRRERGALLAYISLAVCYLLATWALIATIFSVDILIAQ